MPNLRRFLQAGEVESCFQQIGTFLPQWVEPIGGARPRRGRPSVRGRQGCLEDRSSPTSVFDLSRELDRTPSPSPDSSCAGDLSGVEDEGASRKRQRIGAHRHPTAALAAAAATPRRPTFLFHGGWYQPAEGAASLPEQPISRLRVSFYRPAA